MKTLDTDFSFVKNCPNAEPGGNQFRNHLIEDVTYFHNKTEKFQQNAKEEV